MVAAADGSLTGQTPQGDTLRVREVWQDNLEAEMKVGGGAGQELLCAFSQICMVARLAGKRCCIACLPRACIPILLPSFDLLFSQLMMWTAIPSGLLTPASP